MPLSGTSEFLGTQTTELKMKMVPHSPVVMMAADVIVTL
jgi:hypothetical protein